MLPLLRSSLLPALLAAGCAAPPPARVEHREAAEFVRSIPSGRAILRTLRAEASVEVRRGGRRAKFHVQLLAAGAERLYFESSGFAFPTAMVAVDGGATTLYLPGERRAFRAQGAFSLAKILGVSLSSAEWIRLLLGQLPRYGQRVVEASGSAKSLRVVTEGEGVRTSFEFDRRSAVLRELHRESPEQVSFSFGDPVPTAAGIYPMQLRVRAPGASVEIRFKRVVPDPAIPAADFRIDLPAGVEVEPLERAELLKGR